MGFIILETANTSTSFIIRKNPATAPHTRPVRKGSCIGWYGPGSDGSDKVKYAIRFVDFGESVSFPRNSSDTYDYLPYMKYCAPILLTVCAREFLGTATNQTNPLDIPGPCSITQAVMKLKFGAVGFIEKCNKYIKNYQINLIPTEVAGIYKVSISSESSSIENLLKFGYIMGYIFNALTFEDNDRHDASVFEKIFRFMNSLNIPYYIRYVFKIRVCAESIFNKHKKLLEGSDSVSMVYGSTQDQRYNVIKKYLGEFIKTNQANKLIHIVDVGSGEGFYVKKLINFLSKIPDLKYVYHAHDISEEAVDKLIQFKKTDLEKYSNLTIYDDFDKLSGALNGFDYGDGNIKPFIIFSEVIEHIGLDILEDFLSAQLFKLPFKQLIVTTPQVDFNANYMMEPGEFRHGDHKQEMNKQEFVDLIGRTIGLSGIPSTIKYIQIGDIINGISMGQGVVINQS